MEEEAKTRKAIGKGHISDDLHQQAKKIDSPVVNEILVAARKGYREQVVEALARKGGGADATDRHGRNCLHLACLYGHFETVLAILQSQQININSANKRGLTALHDACAEGHTKIALLLLSMGAYIMARTKDGWTCLMSACSNGHLQLAEILIAAGSEINTTTLIGLSALHIAAWKGHSAVVHMLIKVGGDVKAVSKNGKTPLDLSQEEEQKESIKILQSATSKHSEDPSYRIASLEGQLRLCQDKLSSFQSNYEQQLKQEREQNKETVSRLEREKEHELDKSRLKLTKLDAKVSELQTLLKKSINSPPKLTVDTVPTPPLGSPKNRRSRGKKDKERTLEDSKPGSGDSRRSASFSDLTSIVGDAVPTKKTKATKLSPEIQRLQNTPTSQRRTSVEKRSITDLITESMKNPSSIAAIRQELKSDSFTPKMQRKFVKKPSNQTTLPSMSPTSNGSSQSDRSPLLKDMTKGSVSPKVSPPSHPRWNKQLRDSAI